MFYDQPSESLREIRDKISINQNCNNVAFRYLVVTALFCRSNFLNTDRVSVMSLRCAMVRTKFVDRACNLRRDTRIIRESLEIQARCTLYFYTCCMLDNNLILGRKDRPCLIIVFSSGIAGTYRNFIQNFFPNKHENIER